MSVHVVNDDVVPVVPEKDVTEETPKQAVAGSSTEADSYDRTKEAAVATSSEKGHRNRRGSREHLVSLGAMSSVNGTESLIRRDQRQR